MGNIKVLDSVDELLCFQEDGDKILDKRHKELRVFLNLWKSDPFTMRNKTSIRADHIADQGSTRTLVEFLQNSKVDGKQWSNGIFGSRWADLHLGGEMRRISFYSKKSDPKASDNWNGKDYILTITAL